MRKYLFTEDFKYYIGEYPDFKSKDFEIRNGYAIIKKGFEHDGCTPKWKLPFSLGWIGTPDGITIKNEAITQKASGLHDCFYNHKGEHGVSRKDADLIFYRMLKDRGFKLAFIYYIIVRLFGWIMGSWNGRI